MSNIRITNDLLRNELKDYYNFAKEKLGYVSTVDDLLNFDEEFIDMDIDGDSEILYDMINDYINLNANDDFDVQINIDKSLSIQLKEMMIIQLYEYVTYNYDMSLDEERDVYDRLVKNPTAQNAIRLYDNHFLTIINFYCSIVLDNYDISKIIECRKNILRDNRLDIVCSICPFSAFDYRFLLGIKFENENISSIKLGKKIIELVDKAKTKIKNNSPLQLKKYIHIVVATQPEIASFIESNQNFIISNTYEHLLKKEKLDETEKIYVEKLEQGGLNELLSLLFKMDDSLEFLIQLFYQYNKNNLSEKTLYSLRKSTKEKGKVKIIEKINPYYYEEDGYFNNNKNVSE